MSALRQRQPRIHDPAHLARIRLLPCLVCPNGIETQAAHVKYADEARGKRYSGISEKSDDKWAVPLCGKCHAHQHSMNEREFWEIAGIDPLDVAERLYLHSNNPEECERVIRAARS